MTSPSAYRGVHVPFYAIERQLHCFGCNILITMRQSRRRDTDYVPLSTVRSRFTVQGSHMPMVGLYGSPNSGVKLGNENPQAHLMESTVRRHCIMIASTPRYTAVNI